MLHFLLNDTVVLLSPDALCMSVLDWLRTKQTHKGTKEGCASGDCGACTVVIGQLQHNQMHFQSANACLLPMRSVIGKQLITVEALQHSDQLHPVQQAMVDCHGSQCGFCTPGFIMSLFTLYLNHNQYPGLTTVIDSLSGNLCRCTGYKPIIQAAEKAFDYPRVDIIDHQEVINKLAAMQTQETTSAADQHADFAPETLSIAFDLLAKYPDIHLFSGATDWFLEKTQHLKTIPYSLYLGNIDALKQIIHSDQGISIGAAVSYSDFVPSLLTLYPEVKEVFSRLGSQQIRNQGTLGGSLGNASPIGDPAPFLLAINATITVVSADGKRDIPMREFFTGYKSTQLLSGEIIQAIFIPKLPKNAHLFFYKVSKRYEDDISTVCMALLLQTADQYITSINTGFGGMAAIPQCAPLLESALMGQPLTEPTFLNAVESINEDFSPMSDSRASSEYRQLAAKNLVMRAFYDLSGHTVRIHHA